jgi:hypothetical protein
MSDFPLLDLMGDVGQAPKPISVDAAPRQNMTEYCELELVRHYTNDARGEVFVSTDGDEAKAVWLRLDAIQCVETGRVAPATTTQGKRLANGLPVVAVNLPEWLARQQGLI